MYPSTIQQVAAAISVGPRRPAFGESGDLLRRDSVVPSLILTRNLGRWIDRENRQNSLTTLFPDRSTIYRASAVICRQMRILSTANFISGLIEFELKRKAEPICTRRGPAKLSAEAQEAIYFPPRLSWY
jgi:hypothetical protein